MYLRGSLSEFMQDIKASIRDLQAPNINVSQTNSLNRQKNEFMNSHAKFQFKRLFGLLEALILNTAIF